MRWLQLFDKRTMVAAEPVDITEKEVNEALRQHHGKDVLKAIHWLIQEATEAAMLDASDERRESKGTHAGGRMEALMELRGNIQRRSGAGREEREG